MTTLIRWVLALAVLMAGALIPVASAPAAAAAPSSGASGAGGHRGDIDGIVLRHLPAGLGASTDFGYEYDDVSFAARVWESGSAAQGWRVELDVDVMRGARLSDDDVLHEWFVAYQQRPCRSALRTDPRARSTGVVDAGPGVLAGPSGARRVDPPRSRPLVVG